MTLTEITERDQWEALLEEYPHPSFLQSWEWGAFQASLGKRVKRFAIQDKSDLVACAQWIHESRPLVGGYWMAPKGPLIFRDVKPEAVVEDMKDKLAEESVFLRIEPEEGMAVRASFPNAWHRRRAFNPSATFLLDLTRPEEDVLAGMHQKTRYNIRVAERHGVTVREGSHEDLPAFLTLMKETADRDQFLQRDEAYLRKTYEYLAKTGMARLRIAEHEGEALAANLEIAYAGTVTYLYGASSSEKRNMMAPFLLHWEAIRAAKREGAERYDFWGANPQDEGDLDFKPSWQGITRFKKNWGAELIEYVGTYDIPLQPLLYRIIKLLGRA